MSLHLTKRVLLPLGIAASISACGGGGSSPAGPPNPLYVNATSGSDTNLGDQSHPLASVLKAAQLALDGYKIVVAPGTYKEGGITTSRQGKDPRGVQFVADASGTQTGTAAGPVTIDATGSSAGFNLSSSSAAIIDGDTIKAIIDGFTISGAIGSNSAGIVVKSGSDDLSIQNCIIHDNGDDGIRVQDSTGVLVFNNLVYDNAGDGINIAGNDTGSPNARLYNNTVFSNGGHGVTIGTSGVASPRASLRNNIVQDNAGNIKVFTRPRSDLGFDGNCNLVFPASYDGVAGGTHDLATDAKFVNPPRDFHLRPNSPAIDASDPSDCALIGLPNSQQLILRQRTTVTKGDPDGGWFDLGFHFLRN